MDFYECNNFKNNKIHNERFLYSVTVTFYCNTKNKILNRMFVYSVTATLQEKHIDVIWKKTPKNPDIYCNTALKHHCIALWFVSKIGTMILSYCKFCFHTHTVYSSLVNEWYIFHGEYKHDIACISIRYHTFT